MDATICVDDGDWMDDDGAADDAEDWMDATICENGGGDDDEDWLDASTGEDGGASASAGADDDADVVKNFIRTIRWVPVDAVTGSSIPQ